MIIRITGRVVDKCEVVMAITSQLPDADWYQYGHEFIADVYVPDGFKKKEFIRSIIDKLQKGDKSLKIPHKTDYIEYQQSEVKIIY